MKTDIPFVPSSEERLATMMKLANVKAGQKTVDLGSGDGRVVIACAKCGAEAYGYELDPVRVILAKDNIEKENLLGDAYVEEKSFWDVDLSSFDIVTVYGIGSIMERLEGKLKRELKKGAKVISNYYTFPTWNPLIKKENVYLYIKGWE